MLSKMILRKVENTCTWQCSTMQSLLLVILFFGHASGEQKLRTDVSDFERTEHSDGMLLQRPKNLFLKIIDAMNNYGGNDSVRNKSSLHTEVFFLSTNDKIIVEREDNGGGEHIRTSMPIFYPPKKLEAGRMRSLMRRRTYSTPQSLISSGSARKDENQKANFVPFSFVSCRNGETENEHRLSQHLPTSLTYSVTGHEEDTQDIPSYRELKSNLSDDDPSHRILSIGDNSTSHWNLRINNIPSPRMFRTLNDSPSYRILRFDEGNSVRLMKHIAGDSSLSSKAPRADLENKSRSHPVDDTQIQGILGSDGRPSPRFLGIDVGDESTNFQAGMWLLGLVGLLATAIPAVFLDTSLGFKRRRDLNAEDRMTHLGEIVHNKIKTIPDKVSIQRL